MTLNSDLGWRRSTFSGQQGGNSCVEVANTLGAVRDSKAPDAGVLHGDIATLVAWVRGRQPRNSTNQRAF